MVDVRDVQDKVPGRRALREQMEQYDAVQPAADCHDDRLRLAFLAGCGWRKEGVARLRGHDPCQQRLACCRPDRLG